MIYNDDELRGLQAPPLIDDKFCIHTYRQWMTVNKLWPWMMNYDNYKAHLDKTSKPLSDNMYVRYDQLNIRLSMLKHWFESVEQAIKLGYEIEEHVIKDYESRIK